MTDFFATSFTIPQTGDTMPAGSLCAGDLPLVLLPVRLETRFFTLPDDSTELRVRVFPDKIHLDSHEPELTADEQRWGQHYWEQNWRAGDDARAAREAWRQLADRMGAQRAAWIVRVLVPHNAFERPTSPTPSEEPLPVAPVWVPITVAARTDTWRHPPQARLLPDRWLAVVHSAGRVAVTVTGNDIPRLLAVGPDPEAPEPDEATEDAIARGEQLAIDAGMKWMTDFGEAASAGMALRIPIPADTLAAGLDSLVVFGVSRSLNVAETTAALADLFDAHHYTDGLAFLRPGTPTNNTDDRRAGYNSDDPGHERSFASEIAGTPALDDNNASRVGTALGLGSDRILGTFGRVERGLEHDDRHARSMNTALWQVGWGYYLRNMIGAEAGITQADIDWARRHFLDHVRGFGPLPALRCGAQPYGLLPVTSLDLWNPNPSWAHDATGRDIWLNRMLRDLRDRVWRPAAGSIARIGNRQNDPDADLADVMRTDGLSGSYLVGNIFGGQYLRHLYRFLGTDMPGSDPAQTALLEQLGIAWRPRLSRMWNGGGWNVRAPLVQPGEVSPWAALEPNYIAALLAEHSIDNLILARPDPQHPDRTATLLQVLLRHAYLREIAEAAARFLADETGADPAGLLRDAELIDLVAGEAPTLHWKRQLDHPVAVAGGHTIREYLESALSHAGPFQPAQPALSDFGANHGPAVNHGWQAGRHPRMLADLTGNGRADIVGFGDDGVYTALSNGDGTFQDARPALSDFGANHGSGVNGGWQVGRHPRMLADLTGNGKADIVGFGDDGVYTALSNGNGTFQDARPALSDFGANHGHGVHDGWRTEHPRMLADLTGNGKADIVGFGDDGVWVAISNGDGTFRPARPVLSDFGANHGSGVDDGWRVERHPRLVADLTGDGRADIVGFGDDGMRTALNNLNNGDGTFAGAQRVFAEFGFHQNWKVDQHPRLLADLTGNGKADLVAFSNDGPVIALSNGDGGFATWQWQFDGFNPAWGWGGDTVRLVADLTGDGRADIIGFKDDGVWTALNNGDGTFQPPRHVLADFGDGWLDQHPRLVADLTGDGRADIVGFGDDGVSIALNTFPLSAVGEFRSGLEDLQRLDSEALSHLMQGTLDLSAHRLDAWVTSVATKRLAAMRSFNPTGGQYIGGYGWVENLQPMNPSLVTPIDAPPPGEPGPLQAAPHDSGFIHAPSVTHAAAAALLRNAHLGPTGEPSATAPFAIDLSSRRVREASRLLEGVRHGQPLGALLGYRVERALHDTVVDNGPLDRFIAPLRRLAPLVARATTQTSAPVEAIAADNVVDGLVLYRRWTEEPDVRSLLIADVGPPPPTDPEPTDPELQAVDSIITALGDAIDGLTDALTAELAYQMVRGNTARTASTLAAITSAESASPPPEGAAPPPELEVTRIRRSGTSLTHRLLLLWSGPPGATPGWASFDTRARSAAEPMLNFWAFQLLGDPSRVRCTIGRLDEATGAVVEPHTFPLSDVALPPPPLDSEHSELALAPLDVVYGVEAANTSAQPGMALSEVEQRVLYHARIIGGFGADAVLQLQHDRPPDLAPAEVTLFDLLEQARAVRGLLAVARGADPDDLTPPERAAQAVIDWEELENRVTAAEIELNTAHTDAIDLIADTTTTAEKLRTKLLELGSFGVGPAVPISASGDDAAAKEALAQQGRALLKLSKARLDQGTLLRAAPAAADPHGRLQQLTARMRAVFGPSFVVAPRFTLDADGATEFGSALAASTAAQGGDPLAAHTWFGRCARVRDAVARFASCLQRADVVGTGTRLDLSVAQLPFVTNEDGVERWVGLAPLPETVLPPSKLSLVIQTLAPIDSAQVLSGLLVDEWVEVVPSSQETTALAFQFDTPDSCAPQCVLIAVPPSPGQDWTAETLRRVLMETLDLAKLRGVDTRSLGAAAQQLPGLYLAFNAKDHAVSTDFASLRT